MERIFYAGSSFLTGDAIAHAVMNYAALLIEHETSAVVEIPTRHSNGFDGSAWFLLGPQSNIFSLAEASAYPEIEDDDLVTELRNRSVSLALAAEKPRSDTSGGTDATVTERFFDHAGLRHFL